MIAFPGQAPRFVPVAYRRFKLQGLLYCSYEVVGMTNANGLATTHVTGRAALSGSAGQIVRQASPTPIGVALGGKVEVLILPLAGLEAGEYDLVLDIVDEGTGRTPSSPTSPSCWNPPPPRAPFLGNMLPPSVKTVGARALIAAAALSSVAWGAGAVRHHGVPDAGRRDHSRRRGPRQGTAGRCGG